MIKYLLFYILCSPVVCNQWGSTTSSPYTDISLSYSECLCPDGLSLLSNGTCLNVTSLLYSTSVCKDEPYWGAVFVCWMLGAMATGIIFITSINVFKELMATIDLFFKSNRRAIMYENCKTYLNGIFVAIVIVTTF